MKKLLFLLLLPLAFSCNGQSKRLPKNMDTKDIPSLAKSLEDDFYKIQKVTSGTWNEILYDPTNDFYVIAQNEKVTKLNNKGDIVFEMNKNEKDPNGMPDFMDFHNPSYFVISWYGIYDLSEEKPHLEKFQTVFNDDEKMEWKEWDKRFGDLYNNADIVLWGFRKSAGRNTYPLYFRKGGKWMIMYTLKNTSGLRTNGNYVRFSVNKEEIPDRFDRLYLLKDVRSGTYSNYNNYNGEYDNSNLAEDSMKYDQRASIETLSFKKEVTRDAPYSHVPVHASGTAVNKLTIGKSQFTFKSKGIGGTAFNKVDLRTYLYLFEVPLKFKTKSVLSFIYYYYPTNWNEDENQGVYVIKEK